MKRIFGLLLTLMPNTMAILVMEFSRGGYKIEETYLIIPKSIFKVNLEMKKKCFSVH